VAVASVTLVLGLAILRRSPTSLVEMFFTTTASTIGGLAVRVSILTAPPPPLIYGQGYRNSHANSYKVSTSLPQLILCIFFDKDEINKHLQPKCNVFST
jgi:hypothetical protein